MQELSESGRDPVQFMRDLTAHLRQLIVMQTLGEPPDSFSVTADQVPRLESPGQGPAARPTPCARIDLLADAIAQVKEGSDPRTQLEVALLKAARPSADASIEALLTRIERLERGGPGPRCADEPRVTRAPTRSAAPGAKSRPRRSAQAVACSSTCCAPARRPPSFNALWPAVLERVGEGEGGEMLAALLADARPVALEDDVLVLSYPASASFSKRKIEDRANGQRLGPRARARRGPFATACGSS